MLKVYLAAPYQFKDQMNVCAEQLRRLGIEVTSRWLKEPHQPNTQLGEVSTEEKQKYALQDLDDIYAADVFVLFTDSTKTIIRAGRHVEFGIAVNQGMPIIVVGSEYENIFHYLPSIRHVNTWDDAIPMLLAFSS